MSEASAWSATSRAMSSGVPPAAMRRARTPSRSSRSAPSRRSEESACSSTSRAEVRASSETTWRAPRSGSAPSPASPTTTRSGTSPRASSASAPASIPTRTGRCSRMKRRSPRRSLSWSKSRTTTTTGRPAMRVRRSGKPSPVQEQVLLAAQELGGVVGEAGQLGGEPGAGVVHRRQHVVEVEHRSRSRPSRRARAPVPCASSPSRSAPSLTWEDLGPDALDEQHPGPDEHLGPEAGVAPGDERRGVDHRGHAALEDRLGARAVEVDVVDDQRRRRGAPGAARRRGGGRRGRCRRDRRVGRARTWREGSFIAASS